MPRLLTLLPCQKVIVDRAGIPSLIALFESVNIAPAQGEIITQVPQDTVTFWHWAVFSEWELDPHEGEVGKTEQVFELQFPDGSVAPIKGKIPFEFKKPGTYRNHQEIFGFPVGHEGHYQIRVWLEKDGKRISDVATRRMSVVHKVPPGAQTVEMLAQSPKND